MVDREVDVPVWGLRPKFWWPLLAVWGRSWVLSWRSWAALGAYVGGLGRLLRPMWAVLGLSWGLCWRSWAVPGAYVGGLGPLLGPMLAVLGRSWGLCWRSWAVLRPKVAQTRAGRRSGKRTWAEKWPKPEREGRRGEGMVFPLYFGPPAPPVDFFL